MQLHEQIERKRIEFAKAKPRSERRTKVHRDCVALVLKQLRKEIRQDKRRS